MAALGKDETRSATRVMTVQVALAGSDTMHPIRVRNLSAGGLMGEGDIVVDRGSQLKLVMPNVGLVSGTVAWIQDDRFGVAFADDIDPDAVLMDGPVECDDGDPRSAGIDTERRSETRLH